VNFKIDLISRVNGLIFESKNIQAPAYSDAVEYARDYAHWRADELAQDVDFDVNEDAQEEPDEACGLAADYGLGQTPEELGVEGPFTLEESSGRWQDYYGGWISPDNQVYFVEYQRHIPSIQAIYCANDWSLPEGNPNTYSTYCRVGWIRIYTNDCSVEEGGFKGNRCRENGIGISTFNVFHAMQKLLVAFAQELDQNPDLKTSITLFDDQHGTDYTEARIIDYSPTSTRELVRSTAGTREVYDAPGEFSVYANNPYPEGKKIINVFGPDGKVAFSETISAPEEVMSVLRRAYYEYGLVNPNFEVVLEDSDREAGNNPPRYENEVEFNPYLPNPEAQAIAQDYVASKGFPPIQDTGYVQVDPRVSKQIAQAFQDMPDSPDDLLTQAAYQALAQEVDDQFELLPVQVVSTTEYGSYPYKTSPEMMNDVMQNKRLVVFDGGDEHSLLTREQTFKFRAVHDYFGHAQHGFAFGPRGEENAWLEHSKMFSPLARLALTSETRGQNSYVNFGPHSHLPVTERPYADQKVGVLPMEFQLHPEFIVAYERWPGFLDIEHQIRQVASNPFKSKLLSALEEKYKRPQFEVPEESEEGLFAYRKEKHAGGRPLTGVRFSKKTLERVWNYFNVGQSGLNWYEETPVKISEAFNYDTERTRLFIGFLAATSPLRNIWRNTELALKAMRQWDNCKIRSKKHQNVCEKDIASCFNLDMPNHESNAQRVVCGSPLSGPKVSAFYRNLTERPEEDSGAVTVDTWMCRAFDLRGPRSKEEDKDGAPSTSEFKAIEKKVQEMAAQAGVLPRQFQAAVWVGIKMLEGSPEDKADPFEKALFQQLEAAAQQEVFEFQEAEDIPEIQALRQSYRGVQARKTRELEEFGPLEPELARSIGEPEEHFENPPDPDSRVRKLKGYDGVIVDMLP
jgi:hypothetical protein